MEFPECWVLLVIPGALKKRLRPTVVPDLKAHGKFQLDLAFAKGKSATLALSCAG